MANFTLKAKQLVTGTELIKPVQVTYGWRARKECDVIASWCFYWKPRVVDMGLVEEEIREPYKARDRKREIDR